MQPLDADDPDVPIDWAEEIRRRIDEIEAGTAKLEDWESVKARLAAASTLE